EGRPTKLRVGGGWLLAPEVPGLADGQLNEADALRALAAANAAGCLAQDGRVVYTGSQGSAATGPRPRSAPAGGRQLRSPRPSPRGSPTRDYRSDSPNVQATQTCDLAHKKHEAYSFAPKAATRLLGPGQMGPERFKALEQERASLSERLRTGQGAAPETSRGYIIGTYVQGGQRSRFSSDRGPRAAFRVLRSRITKDATLDPDMLRKSSDYRGCGGCGGCRGCGGVAADDPAEAPAADTSRSALDASSIPLDASGIQLDASGLPLVDDLSDLPVGPAEDDTFLSSSGEEDYEEGDLEWREGSSINPGSCSFLSPLGSGFPPRPGMFGHDSRRSSDSSSGVGAVKRLKAMPQEPMSGIPSTCPSTRASFHDETSASVEPSLL
ncbi:unnamed protein product, partial [Polarella glacialis]